MFWKFNKVVKVLIMTDMIVWSGWGFVAPIFAVFILQSINGGNAEVAGIATGIFLIVKSFLIIPMGALLDRLDGERDDLWAMIFGTAGMSLVPLGYIFSSEPWHIYALQAFYGVAMAAVEPAWGGIFTRHIDKGKEAQSWGVETALLGFGTGITGILGGFLVQKIGFVPVFMIVSLLGFLGTLGYIVVHPTVKAKRDKGDTITFPKGKRDY